MSDFPSSPAFSSPTPDVATGVPRLESFLKAAKQGIGRGLQSLTIASGSITPADGASGSIKVDTESSAATDDLTNIAQTNIPDGHYVMLQIADNGRVVTVKHNAGGTGDIELTGGLDFQMNRVEQRLLLQRSGTTWVEVMRSGREKNHEVDAAGEPAFQASWTAGSPAMAFWKDESGVVRMSGIATHASLSGASSLMFTLPAGYRPAGDTNFPVYVETPASALGYIYIHSSGQVYAAFTSSLVSVNTVVTADPVFFRAAA